MGNSILTSGSSRRLDRIFLLTARYKCPWKIYFLACPPMILRRGQNFSPSGQTETVHRWYWNHATRRIDFQTQPNKMNFKSFPFPVHLHNLYIVKVYVRFRLFFGIQRFRSFCSPASREGGGLRIWVGILAVAVSLRGVNFGFWSHLGCSGHMYIFSSLLGVKKAWATPRSVSFTGLIQNFRRASPTLSYAESSPGLCITFWRA